MRFYPIDQGLSALFEDIRRKRAAGATPPPIDRQVGARGENRFPSPPPAIPPQTFSAPQHAEIIFSDGKCNPHPDAPHGFNRNQSHTLGRYVCDCEGWSPDE